MDKMDELWPGGPVFVQETGVFKLGSDSVFLADFVNLSGTKTVFDIGCGAGILPVLIGTRLPDAQIDAIDISKDAAALAQKNIALNSVNANIMHGDIRMYKETLKAGYYDLVTANPPYFQINSGKSAENAAIAMARDERLCTLDDVVRAASYILKWGGRFAVVYRPERLSELFVAMSAVKIEPKRVRLVLNRPDSIPSLVLCEGKRGGRPGLNIMPSLVLSNDDGSESREIRKIYRREGY
ncbi:MAG: methyltransferase [Clostridiales bacterium]|nr:methyltransferase [Clostridiales bacterium]